jgi:signal peptidase I
MNQDLLFQLFPIAKYTIVGDSMAPTILENQTILINRLAYVLRKPTTNDIIALKDPRDGKILIKRITKIVNNKYFVTGDNKEHSTDSREFGMIEKSDILGKILM